jgi:hypothetical protein
MFPFQLEGEHVLLVEMSLSAFLAGTTPLIAFDRTPSFSWGFSQLLGKTKSHILFLAFEVSPQRKPTGSQKPQSVQNFGYAKTGPQR